MLLGVKAAVVGGVDSGLSIWPVSGTSGVGILLPEAALRRGGMMTEDAFSRPDSVIPVSIAALRYVIHWFSTDPRCFPVLLNCASSFSGFIDV